MKITKRETAIKILDDLHLTLQKLCHDKNCKNVNVCPKVCLCKKRRNFKLNNDTAACWELANILSVIYDQLYHNTLTCKSLKIKRDQIYLIRKLMYYHPTSRGWTNLYTFVNRIVDAIDRGLFYHSSYVYANCKDYLKRINYISLRIKRDKY